jgi:hypothetical protein
MITVRLATAQDIRRMPGILRVRLEGLEIPVDLLMPPPGLSTTSQELPPPRQISPFTLKLRYFLDEEYVGVRVGGVGKDDSVEVFASRLDRDGFSPDGVFYAGNIIHSDMGAAAHDCEVQCEFGDPKIEECCIICRSENIVTKTCC